MASPYELQYKRMRHRFDCLRRSFMRTCHQGRFILVDDLTEALEQDDLLSNGQTASGLYNLMWISIPSREPPDLDLQKLKERCRIFYIILEMDCPWLLTLFRHVKDSELPVTKSTLIHKIGAQELLQAIGEDWEAVCDRFCEAQAEWCPLMIEWDLDTVVHEEKIPPFYLKKPIQASRDRGDPWEGYATLYEIHVPAELVGQTLKDKLPSADLLYEHVPGFGCDQRKEHRYYRLALKEFPKTSQSSFESFDRERRAFVALREQKGMIQYVGCYEHRRETDSTYNIILEYADFDLYGSIEKEAPPMSPKEIKSFWASMLEIAETLQQIHHIEIAGHTYNFWHGDIKPENILRVDDHFKLADPGEASIKSAEEGDPLPATAVINGGTRTYAAPEKAAYLDGTADSPGRILQNSDVWSLACVYSIVATYVVLGTQGVLQYDAIRRLAHSKADTGLIRDAFHDGSCVLQVVTDWHRFLRSTMRRTDAYTARILDLIDNHMLVKPEQRWDAGQVCEGLRRIFESPATHEAPVPPSIEQMLEEIDLEAEIRLDEAMKIRRVDSDHFRRRLESTTDHSTDTTLSTRSRSHAKLVNIGIQPTAQRTLYRPQRTQSQRSQRPFQSVSNEEHIRGLSYAPSGSTIDDIQNLGLSSPSFPATPPSEQPVTVWQVLDELEQAQRADDLRSLLKRPFRGSYVPMKGRAKLNDPLAGQYHDRDIIYVIDNGLSMARHWSEATFLLRVLVWRSLGYDDDGMELYFTDPDTTNVSVKTNPRQTVANFVDAMGKAKPHKHSNQTDLWTTLDKIKINYASDRQSSKREKPKTVIILTDGVWGRAGEHDMEEWMKETLSRLARLHGMDYPASSSHQATEIEHKPILEQVRPLTFQFVAFGLDPKGIERMRRLDELGPQNGLPDLIDMEPSNGDVYKMFLGSLVPDWDSKRNYANSPLSAESPWTVPSPIASRVQSLSPESARAARLDSQQRRISWSARWSDEATPDIPAAQQPPSPLSGGLSSPVTSPPRDLAAQYESRPRSSTVKMHQQRRSYPK